MNNVDPEQALALFHDNDRAQSTASRNSSAMIDPQVMSVNNNDVFQISISTSNSKSSDWCHASNLSNDK